MTNIVEIEISKALRAAGCGILRKPQDPGLQVEKVPANGTPPSLMHLLRTVSLRTGWTISDMRSPRRFADLVRARMIYYFVARHVTCHSIPSIGKSCGGRDHSTVLHGLRTVEKDRARFEPEISELLTAYAGSAG